MQRDCVIRIACRGRLTSFSVEYKTGKQSLFECAESLTKEQLRRVARQFGRFDCVVRRCWDQWIRETTFTRRPSSGRPRQTSRREDHHIRHTSPTAGVMVWGVIANNTWSPLVLFRGPMAAQCLTRQGCHKIVFKLLLPFLGLPDPQMYLQSSVSGIIWDGEWGIPRDERTRDKVAANMERNVSRHHTELVCLNARSYRIVHSR
ncbi:transposable element Tcb1 transposase [Trichonephila clavipes]|nr:transposable element Tcb1 transposase [Trichonephila clavipes]